MVSAELHTFGLNFVRRIHIRPLLWDFLPGLSILLSQMLSKIRAFIHLFSRYLLNLYYVPSLVLGAGSPKSNETLSNLVVRG